MSTLTLTQEQREIKEAHDKRMQEVLNSLPDLKLTDEETFDLYMIYSFVKKSIIAKHFFIGSLELYNMAVVSKTVPFLMEEMSKVTDRVYDNAAEMGKEGN